jgi:hypothetical protein
VADAPHTLAADTQAVVVNLQVINPKRQKYRLVKVVSVGGTTREEPVAPWTIREHLNLVVPGPLSPGKDVTLTVKILSGEPGREDEPLLSTGELHYRVKAFTVPPPGRTRGEVMLPVRNQTKGSGNETKQPRTTTNIRRSSGKPVSTEGSHEESGFAVNGGPAGPAGPGLG